MAAGLPLLGSTSCARDETASDRLDTGGGAHLRRRIGGRGPRAGQPIIFMSFRNSTEVLPALDTDQLDIGTPGYSVAAITLQHVRVDGRFVAGATAGTTSIMVHAGPGVRR